MADTLLLVHASDVHVGAKITGGGYLWKTTGHDPRAVEAFSTALDRLTQFQGTKVLVVSGDVSARGADAELMLYRTFCDVGAALDAYVTRPAFREGFDAFIDIPGNHDYWSGWLVPNPTLNRSIQQTYFRARPWSIMTPVGSQLVALHGACSTSGATPLEQFFAVGAYEVAEWQALSHSLGDANRRAQVRGLKPLHVLVTHHSPSAGSPTLRGLRLVSRTALISMCTNGRIRAILNGHAHSSAVVRDPSLPTEIRCSTTLQMNLYPQRQTRQFWVHVLSAENGGVRWTVTPWVFDNHRSFIEVVAQREDVGYFS